MPTSVVPSSENRPEEPEERELESRSEPGLDSGNEDSPRSRTAGGSRWIDYDTHELLDMISELEDERRWARLREGILWAILFHILLLSAITWFPKYVLRQPAVIDPFDAINQRKDLKYLDLPPDLMRKYQQPKPEVKPTPQRQPQIDRKMLDRLKQEDAAQPKPPVPEPQQQTPPPPPQQQAKVEQPAAPQPQPQPSPEAPHPSSVPAKAFQLGSQNPADQLHQAMRGAAGKGAYNAPQLPSDGGLSMHPGAGSGGVQVLSDTQGVDFTNWLIRWHAETERTWDPLIPDEVNPPISKQGVVVIRFKVLPNGQLMPGSVQIEGRSGDTALDRAAWGALTGSSYGPLPRDFHGPYLELRAMFMYNERPQ